MKAHHHVCNTRASASRTTCGRTCGCIAAKAMRHGDPEALHAAEGPGAATIELWTRASGRQHMRPELG
jgi:hypothetical protein